MGILKALRVMIALGGFGLLAFVAHAYHTGQYEAAYSTGAESKFVRTTGQIDRMGQPEPSLVDTAKTFVNGLLGREEEGPTSELAALRKRQAFNYYSPEERQIRSVNTETDFWTGLFSKFGLTEQ